jgi:hypothetical protein
MTPRVIFSLMAEIDDNLNDSMTSLVTFVGDKLKNFTMNILP